MLAVEASTNKAIDGAITLVSVLTGKTKAQLDLEYKTKDVTDAENELINEAPAEENLEDLPSNTTDAMADNLDKETDVITESAEAIVAKTTEY
jgi:hypothetical protein